MLVQFLCNCKHQAQKIMSTTQLLSNLLLCLSLIFHCSFAVSPFGKIIPRFPSPLIHPKNSQPSLSNDQSNNNGLYETRYFAQTLDHFSFRPESYQTFQHKYLINSTFWGGRRRNSPIFIYTGNEGDIEWFAQNTGFMFKTAPLFNAFLVFIKHRYYGKSIPFGGNEELASSNASTLGYLSSSQALVDYATLITDLKKNLTASIRQ